MRLKVCHTTTYRYSREVAFNSHYLMLRPRGGPDLQVLEHELALSPQAELVWGQDVFGNLVATAHITRAARELVVTSVLRLDTNAAEWPVYPIEPRAQAHPFHYTIDEVLDLGALYGPDTVHPAVAAWAHGFVATAPTDALSLLKHVNAGVCAAATYKAREAEGTQTARETLGLASGSCRDLAALFVDAVRSLGFGARAVSGYLFDPSAATGAADTTHAWAEVFLPGAGWIPFDPTHARTGGARLITVAVARCNAQILPVTGSYVGAAQDFVGMEVEVCIDSSADAQPPSRIL